MSTRIPVLAGHERPHNLVVQLREAFTALNDLVVPHLVEHGFTDFRAAHGAVFQYLDDTGTTVSTLATRAQMTKQAMAELVGHLERSGYVVRVPDPDDRRAKRVLPTERGRDVIDVAQRLAPEIEERVERLIGAARLSALRADLEAIRADVAGTEARHARGQATALPGARPLRHPARVLVRREGPDDVDAVRAVVGRAFPTPDGAAEPVEVGLLDALRADPGWLPAFSLVAVDPPGEVVGHVVATRGDVDGHPALGLGPLAVRPDRQGRGVGTALVHAVLGAAEARDEVLVALLGEPAYYGRFGFRPSTEHGVISPAPAWGGYFQVRALTPATPRGTFRYAAPFAAL